MKLFFCMGWLGGVSPVTTRIHEARRIARRRARVHRESVVLYSREMTAPVPSLVADWIGSSQRVAIVHPTGKVEPIEKEVARAR